MSATERQQRWRANKNRKGMTRLDIWVPTDRVDGVRALVADLVAYPDMAVVGLKEEPDTVSEPVVDFEQLSEFEQMQAQREVAQLIDHCDRLCEHEGGSACRFDLAGGSDCMIWKACQVARTL